MINTCLWGQDAPFSIPSTRLIVYPSALPVPSSNRQQLGGGEVRRWATCLLLRAIRVRRLIASLDGRSICRGLPPSWLRSAGFPSSSSQGRAAAALVNSCMATGFWQIWPYPLSQSTPSRPPYVSINCILHRSKRLRGRPHHGSQGVMACQAFDLLIVSTTLATSAAYCRNQCAPHEAPYVLYMAGNFLQGCLAHTPRICMLESGNRAHVQRDERQDGGQVKGASDGGNDPPASTSPLSNLPACRALSERELMGLHLHGRHWVKGKPQGREPSENTQTARSALWPSLQWVQSRDKQQHPLKGNTLQIQDPPPFAIRSIQCTWKGSIEEGSFQSQDPPPSS